MIYDELAPEKTSKEVTKLVIYTKHFAWKEVRIIPQIHTDGSAVITEQSVLHCDSFGR